MPSLPRPSARREVDVTNQNGIHVRPTTQIVEAANRFDGCEITLRRGADTASAKSVIEVLGMAIVHGERVLIETDGDGAEEAADTIAQLFVDRFGFEH